MTRYPSRSPLRLRCAKLVPATLTLLACVNAFAAGVSVIPEAAYSGARGMRITLNDASPAFVEDATPSALARYRCRFYINRDDLTMPNGAEVDVLHAVNAGNQEQFAIKLHAVDATIRLNVEVRLDNATILTLQSADEPLVRDAWRAIEVDWKASSAPGANDGHFHLWVEGVQIPAFDAIDTDQRQIDTVRLGMLATSDPAISGSYDLDEFISRTDDFIGSTPTTSGLQDVSVLQGDAPTVINLFDAFADAEDTDDELTYTLTGNSNPAIFTSATLDEPAGTLTLAYGDTLGSSTLTVRATDTNALFVSASFTVTVNPTPPDKATTPDPPTEAIDVPLLKTLSWTAGARTESHDVHFGTVNPPPFVQNQPETTFDPGALTPGTEYFWRVDEKNTGGTTQGDVWSFTTVPEPPEKATLPDPENGATAVPLDADLSWTSGAGATSHDVLFGTTNPPPFVQNQATTTFDPGTLTAGTAYFWRIDEKNAGGTTEGDVWSFTAGIEGDVNGDGALDAVDVQLVINAALDITETPSADQDNDGDVDAVDVQLVINAVLGL